MVLRTFRQLVAELHSGTAASEVRLDSELDTELGLDSLSIAELRVRLERDCGVRLPDQALTRGSTVADWVDLIAEAGTGALLPSGQQTGPRWRREATGTRTPPRQAGTLGEVLAWHVSAHPDQVYLRVLDHGGAEPVEATYADLAGRTLEIAEALAQQGVGYGDRVGIMLATGMDYFATFLGIGCAGAIPVPLYPPARPDRLEEHLLRQARILDNAGAVALVTVPEARNLARLVRARADELRRILDPALLSGTPDAGRLDAGKPEDVAFLQYTSGSTGEPKGVVLSHAHLLANLRAMGTAAHATPSDLFVSWLPLYHDMGLIGAFLGSLYHGMAFVVMPPTDFLSRPSRWLWAIHHHRATLSAAPNFGYELCLRIPDDALAGLDLSSWRLAFNGAEPVNPRTVRRFSARFAGYGFRPEAMAPVYGLAEAALGVTFPPPGRTPPVDVIDRESLVRLGRADPAPADSTDTNSYVGCGRPLPGYQVRIVDPGRQVLEERREGRIEFAGPSATSGYYRAPEQTRRLRHGEWIDTGDLGYLAGGDLYVTGRAKDIIIRAGRNLHPAELEDAVGELPGVRKGCVVAFPATDRHSGTERLVLLAETRVRDPDELTELRGRIRAITVDLLGVPADDVVLAPPGTVPKTSSGKVRRAAGRARYESGELTRPAAPSWWQLVRFAWNGGLPQLRRWRRAAYDGLFAAYAWLVFLVVAPLAWLAVVALPRPAWRWHAIRGAARLLGWATGTRLSTAGAGHLADPGPYVIVANHASYLDGLALLLAAPRPITFVAAADFANRPLAGPLLRRLGCAFVERRHPQPGTPDVHPIARTVASGDSVVFFPEGAISVPPGLRHFHLGAFAVAVQTGVPVLPIGIRGTRTVLRSDQYVPRRGGIEVRVEDPIAPTGRDWPAVVALRDSARQAVLRGSGEHDATT